MRELQIKPLAFPATALALWERGQFDILKKLRPSTYLRRILEEKIRNRRKLGRRFFGEAFVATDVKHEHGWYGSFKWLTSWPANERAGFGAEYRAALREHFPAVGNIAARSVTLRKHLGGKKPVPPDLWLIVNGEHCFIEVKLPRDAIRPPQIAGLAVIATCLPAKDAVSVRLYNLYPEGGKPDPIPSTVQGLYRKFCGILRAPEQVHGRDDRAPIRQRAE